MEDNVITTNVTDTQGGVGHLPKFSIYNNGYVNRFGQTVMAKTPCGVMDLTDADRYIKSKLPMVATQELHKIKDHKLAQLYKLQNFKIATFGGVFSERKANGLVTPTGYMVIDIDGLKSKAQVEDVRYVCINDKRLRSQMVFVSPSGFGIKTVIEINPDMQMSFKEYFEWVTMYMQFEYGIEVDRSGSDICRACYLPHDPNCWINNAYLKE